jgi:hypothetical protein
MLPSEEMLNCAVSGDIIKKNFRLMTFGRCKSVPQGHQGTRLLSYLTKGFLSVGERGHRLTEWRPPFLGEEQVLAVKDADTSC